MGTYVMQLVMFDNTYTNGKDSIKVDEHIQRYTDHLLGIGYTWQPLVGKLGYSELTRHCRMVDQPIVGAFVNKSGTYAHVLDTNGKLTSGCFSVFVGVDGSVDQVNLY